MPPSLERFRRWISCIVIVIVICGIAVAPKFWSSPRPPGVPYGLILIPGTDSLGMQDFACHINYLSHIWNRDMVHPYRLDEQERLAREWCPRNSVGFPHAYSPVTLVLASPILIINVKWAFFFSTILNGILLLLLTWGYLFRRMENPMQGFALMAVFWSYALLDTFNMGQTALLTTCLCAGAYLLLTDRITHVSVTFEKEALLAAVLYVLAFKPSVAFIIYALTISQRAWRPLVLATLGLVLTWVVLAPRYGGYVEGLKDYDWLLNHFCDSDMPAFFRGSLAPTVSSNFTSFVTTLNPDWNGYAFVLSRLLFEGLIVVLVGLGCSRRITPSTEFQGLLWTFLLFCPYLLVTEDFCLCLLAVEGDFFRKGLGGCVKVLFVCIIANVWIGTLLHIPLSFTLKLVLAIWWLRERGFVRALKSSSHKFKQPPLLRPSTDWLRLERADLYS